MRAPFRLTILLALVALAAALPSQASAQEPCSRCIEPDTVRADSKLRVDHPTTRAVWNPRPRLLASDQKMYYVEGSPSVVAYEGIEQAGFVFRAPDVEPGRYLVALFNDSEGDTRYTWDFVTLEEGLPGKAADEKLSGWVIGLAVGAGLLIAAATALALRYRGRSGA